MTTRFQSGLSRSGAAALWVVLLTAASTGTTLVLACMTPFAALAALAAAHLPRRDGIALALLAWGVNQAIGFGLLGYPHAANTYLWGLALGAAAVAAGFAAYAALDRLAGQAAPVRLAAAYVAGFVAFKAVVALAALGLGGIEITLDPALVVPQFARDAAILAGLLALYHALVAIGVPAPRRRHVAFA